MKEVLLSRAINRRNPDEFLSHKNLKSQTRVLRIRVNRLTKIQSLTGCLANEEQINTYYYSKSEIYQFITSSLEIARLFQTESYSFHFFNRSQVVSVISSATLPYTCLLYTSPSPRDGLLSRMPSSA